ncbi:gp12 [Bacillus phage G]|uniref:Gp12 n=1 Tax=Bacillus phage G TaxID=2884420 RepID=G3MB82_9CAUD|nr:gp12 [Bacillus phage G]AEO93283.1 gp12 [Bacillus phage G]
MSRKRRLISQYDNNMNDMDFLMSLDPDLREYFDDGNRLLKTKSTKKKRKKKASFTIGDQVEVNDSYGTVIFGPYESETGKDTYEIECEDGSIVTSEDDGVSIKVYVAPIEEPEKDDLL